MDGTGETGDPATALVAPPAGVSVRRATWDDVDDVAALIADTERDRLGTATFRPVDLRTRWLGTVDFDDTLLVHDPHGELVAYAEFHDDVDPEVDVPDLFVEGRVAPSATGRGLATFLLERADARARQAARRAGSDHAYLETLVADGDDRARAFFTRRGFVPFRHLLDMRLDLTGDLAAADPPAGVVLRGLDADTPPADLERAWRVHQASFDDVPTHLPLTLDEFVRSRLHHDDHADPTLWLLAETATDAVGLVVARVGAPGAGEAGWIRDLGVVPAWRRRGVAMALLLTTCRTLRDRGCSAVQLEVDDVSLDGAVSLYRRAGMTVDRRTDLLVRRVEL